MINDFFIIEAALIKALLVLSTSTFVTVGMDALV